MSEFCKDPKFSGILATIFLGNDTDLLASHQGGMDAVKSYFAKLSTLFGKVQNVEEINTVILTTSLFRQEDFLRKNVGYLRSKENFNENLMASKDVEGCQIKVNLKGTPHVVKHVLLDLKSVFNTEKMADNDFYCRDEIPPKKAPNRAIHIRKLYMEQILAKFLEIKRAIAKSGRRRHRGTKKQ